MSNENEKLDPLTEEVTSSLREDNFKSAKPLVKPTIHIADSEVPLSEAQVIAISKLVQQQTEAAINAATFDASKPVQSVRKSVTPVTDFSKLSLSDVYDLSVPIEAKPFMSADVLAIKLKDTNFEPRWVNKSPQRLGEMIGKGFTYIVPSDLLHNEGIQTSLDAEGHYCFNDVVAMKIDKATYYAALRAAHIRAVSTTNSAGIAKRAAETANSYMRNSPVGNDFKEAAVNKKMEFYDPGVSI